MAARFCVLASGSSGNCAFLQADGFGLLIDAGLGPRFIASRLAAIGANWSHVHAVVLTHTHSDHWKEMTIAHIRRLGIPLYCCPRHHGGLGRVGGNFADLAAAGLVRDFCAGETLHLPGGVRCRPVVVPHDSDPTYGFRIDGPDDLFGPAWSVGYAADLGELTNDLVAAFADVHVLALEFNHDERMQRASGRPRFLIDRVLGPHGHLSNRQAEEAVKVIADASDPKSLRHVVGLHLSRDCNTPTLALKHGREALAAVNSTAKVSTAPAFAVSAIITLDDFRSKRPAAAASVT